MDFKLGDHIFVFDQIDDRIDEVILYKFNRDENGNIVSYSLACKDEDASYECEIKDVKYMFKTFDECLNFVVEEYKNIVIENSKRKRGY